MFAGTTAGHCSKCGADSDPDNSDYLVTIKERISDDCNAGNHNLEVLLNALDPARRHVQEGSTGSQGNDVLSTSRAFHCGRQPSRLFQEPQQPHCLPCGFAAIPDSRAVTVQPGGCGLHRLPVAARFDKSTTPAVEETTPSRGFKLLPGPVLALFSVDARIWHH